MNILLAIADSNKEYLRKISEELQGYSDLTIYVYTSADKLENAMENESFDVVMFDPDLSESKINFLRVKMPICLYSEEAENASLYKECAHISKYQRISKIYKEMIRAYAEKAGYEDVDAFRKAYDEDTIRATILQEAVANYLLESSVQVEAASTDNSTDGSSSDK